MSIPLSYSSLRLGNMVRYGTPRKFLNLTRAYFACLRNLPIVHSSPAFLKVEISHYCDINCLYCFPHKSPQFYPLEAFKELIDQLRDFIFLVSLYDIGEPLHNPQVLEFIRYARKNKIGTILSSSLFLEQDDEFWNALTVFGLDVLIAAIDGVTPETYNRYRRNGKLKLVLSNLRKITVFRDQNHSPLMVE